MGNFAVHGDDVLEAIDQIGSRVVYAHLKDNLEGGGTTFLGGGTMTVDAIIGVLEECPSQLSTALSFKAVVRPRRGLRRV